MQTAYQIFPTKTVASGVSRAAKNLKNVMKNQLKVNQVKFNKKSIGSSIGAYENHNQSLYKY